MTSRHRLLTSLGIVAMIATAGGLGWLLGAPTESAPTVAEAPPPEPQAQPEAPQAQPEPPPPPPNPAPPAERGPVILPVPPPSAPVPETTAPVTTKSDAEVPPEEGIERISVFAPPPVPDLSESQQALPLARQPLPAPEPAPEPEPEPVAATPTVLLHIASYPDLPSARQDCRSLAGRLPGGDCLLRRVTLPRGTFIRVLVRLPQTADPCAPARAAGLYCAPIADEGHAVE